MHKDLAPLSKRFIGQVLDGLVGLILVVVGILLGLAALGIPLGSLYILLSDGFSNGQSWGKRVVRTKVVVEKTLEPCSVGLSLLRNITLVVLGPIDWLFIFGLKRQRLGDLLAGTIVVKA